MRPPDSTPTSRTCRPVHLWVPLWVPRKAGKSELAAENPTAHFIMENGADIFELAAEIEDALGARCQRPNASQ